MNFNLSIVNSLDWTLRFSVEHTLGGFNCFWMESGKNKKREKSMHSTSFCVLLNFECLHWVVSNSGVSAWLPPVLDLKSLCGRSTLGGGLRLGAHGSPTHHTALTTHLFKMPYILSHLVSDRQKDVLHLNEEIGCISWGLPAGRRNQGLLMSQFAQFYIIHFLNLLMWNENYQIINIYMIDSKAGEKCILGWKGARFPFSHYILWNI